MAGAVDSKAVFAARAALIGIDQIGIDAMVLAGFDTMAKWAYSTSYSPGSPDDSALKTLLNTMLGGDPTPGQLSCYRRLYFEAHTTSVSDLRDHITRTEDSGPRKLAPAERAARYNKQKAKLVGLALEGELEISNSLLDEVMGMLEDDQLHYVPLERCTKRDQEFGGVRRDHTLRASPSTGEIKISGRDIGPTADLASDLKIRFALQRRSLAFDQAGLIEYEVFERWNSIMVSHTMQSKLDGFTPVDINQVLRADSKLFQLMGRKTREGIRSTGVARPVELALLMCMQDPEVLFLLMPLPAKGAGPVPKIPGIHPKDPRPKKVARRGGKGEGKGAGKGKGESGSSLFAEFAGMATKDDKGVNICLMFNKACGCKFAAPGAKCGRGRHICAHPGCFKAHGLHEHAAAGA